MKYIVPVLLSIAFIFTSCDKESKVSFNLSPMYDSERLLPNKVIQDANGRNLSIQEIRVYLTDVYLIDEDGERQFISELSFLDWPSVGKYSFDAEIPNGQYNRIEFNVGLDAITNESNPIDFDDSHPLSSQQDTHWGMLKYRFLSVTGQVDTTDGGDQDPQNFLQYHLGRDQLYSPVSIPADVFVDGGTVSIQIPFNVLDLFKGSAGEIDISSHRTNHSGLPDMPNATIIMSNFVEALENY